MAGETTLGKKPYDFIPLVSRCDRQAIKGHDSFSNKTYSGKLNINIKTLSPIHINQGVLGFNQNETDLVNKTIRRGDRVIIPGSGIKGVIRSIAESISYSCAPNARVGDALEPGNRDRCSGDKNTLCPTCSIFGMTGGGLNYKGKIKFSEFYLKDGGLDHIKIPDLSAPFKDYPTPTDILPNIRRGYGNERLYYCNACKGREENLCKTCTKDNYFVKRAEAGRNRPIKFRGRKFYFHNTDKQERGNPRRSSTYEVIMKNSTFIGNLIFENLTREELSLLVFSLGLDGSFNPKIGYAKPAFYGSIEMSLNSVEDLIGRYDKNHKSMDKEFIMGLARKYYQNSSNELKIVIDKLREILDKNRNASGWPTVDGSKVY